ncbi:MAG TPA: 5-methyltetrahydropteroyltriglutamate--homocysteine S-methyltransferase [Alphaproteobacteria bacterium]|nr:5-methyltetrahydropteroyltriglutamate--homocysteine S-methyltransferase [Alphaproteobacteria bacterium]MDP6271016.1 5-methyltetrahydropteroyltriglutamate--homocysteine S-methyltransferase [Alphaproteobacteria bacterium]MDP7426868.1 5-methyltetrahydropteroyltriglutamate--homocysteine S-methyltransferase [Alphaproteobacteria bacterium]HJM51239.1 5-methyltetrahydropteroyltriglutamate--homocysteine S-methyltransferase [Alphaproteobacteria bacterium]
MAPRNPPFRAEHVGSLLRPKKLTQAFRAHGAGRLDEAEFAAIQDQCIRDVVELQENLGLRSITDGEFRRASYWSHFVESVEGFGVRPARFKFRDAEGVEQDFLAPIAEGPVARSQSISGGEFAFLAATTCETPKITIPSPPTMHFWGGDGETAYADRDAFFADLALVYRAEIGALAAAGARYVQVDEVPLAMLCDQNVRQRLAEGGEDAEGLIERYIELINACLGQRPSGVTVALHLCRGNFKGRWLTQGGYDAVAEKMFAGLDVDAFFLEYDTPRAGDFAPLRFVPEEKSVVLGLVTTKSPELENPDDIKRRIDEAAQVVPLDRLALSPQCGFASTVAGNPVTEEDEIRKLSLIVEVAGEVWG